MNVHDSPLTMEIVTDPVEIAAGRSRRARFERNWAWFQAHARRIYEDYRGLCICIAGEEVFAAEKSEAAMASAKTAHPDDDGAFLLYVPREKAVRIYALRREVGSGE